MYFKNKKAFTLAEVAVVLVVMCAIAGILVPTLITSNERRVMITALKKNYEDLIIVRDAINLEAMHKTKSGPLVYNKVDKSKPKEQIDKELTAAKKNFSETFCQDGGIIPSYLKIIKGDAKIKYNKKINDMGYNKDVVSGLGDSIPLNEINDNLVILRNGVIWIPFYYSSKSSDTRFGVRVDVNGIKSPNKIGRDIFYFVYILKATGKWDVIPFEGNGTDCEDYCKDTGPKSKNKDDIKKCTKCAYDILEKSTSM